VTVALRGRYSRWLVRPRWQRHAGLAALLAAIAVLSSRRLGGGGGMPEALGFALNWCHQPLYGSLAVLAAASAGLRLPGASLAARCAIVAFTLAIGVADEFNQGQTPDRDSSLWDLGSDTLGAALALTVAGWTGRSGRPVLEPGPVLFCLGLSLAWNCAPAFLPNLPLIAVLP